MSVLAPAWGPWCLSTFLPWCLRGLSALPGPALAAAASGACHQSVGGGLGHGKGNHHRGRPNRTSRDSHNSQAVSLLHPWQQQLDLTNFKT